ncbi:MAG: hypothetical protein J6S75_07425 [Thermoguttaceae bacterium]|nr:hypothetical protein [Thermoguttaceae bacterium]
MASGQRRWISRSQSVGCRPLFQGCGYGDSPYGNDTVAPFPTMSCDLGELDRQPAANYTVSAVNTVGLESEKVGLSFDFPLAGGDRDTLMPIAAILLKFVSFR